MAIAVSLHSHSYPRPSTLGNHSSDLLSLDKVLHFLETSYKCSHKHVILICLASFTYHNVFEVWPCCSTYLHSLLLLSSIPLHWIYYILLIYSPADGTFGLLQLLWTMLFELSLTNLWTYVLISLGLLPRSGLAGLYGKKRRSYVKYWQFPKK